VAALRRVAFAGCAIGLAACGIDAVGTMLDEGALPGRDGGVPLEGVDASEVDDDAGTTIPDDAAVDGGLDAPADVLIDALTDAGPVIPLLQYLHSSTTLYTVDGTTGLTTAVAMFAGACNGVPVGDIALDRAGKAYVITLPGGGANSTMHVLNLANGSCGASLGDMGRRCNALTFAPDPADGSKDILYAACTSSFYKVSTANATTTLIGAVGPGRASSGDIVWVPGRGVFVTLNDADPTDKLGSINVATGAATVIGTGVGRDAVYALGHRAGVILGYGNGFSIQIDPVTGNGSTWNAATGIDAYGAASGP
jgi:hypothetical protein